MKHFNTLVTERANLRSRRGCTYVRLTIVLSVLPVTVTDKTSLSLIIAIVQWCSRSPFNSPSKSSSAMASSKNANYKQLIQYVAVLLTYTLKGISKTKRHLLRIFGREDPTFFSIVYFCCWCCCCLIVLSAFYMRIAKHIQHYIGLWMNRKTKAKFECSSKSMYGAETKRWSICGERTSVSHLLWDSLGLTWIQRHISGKRKFFFFFFIVKSRIKAHFQQTWISDTKLTPYDGIL